MWRVEFRNGGPHRYYGPSGAGHCGPAECFANGAADFCAANDSSTRAYGCAACGPHGGGHCRSHGGAYRHTGADGRHTGADGHPTTDARTYPHPGVTDHV